MSRASETAARRWEMDEAALAQDAGRAVGYLEAGERLREVAEELQAELVAQWLKEPDAERRERCWNEVRALEAMLGRLVEGLGLDLGTDREDDVGEVVRTSVAGRAWRRLDEWMHREPWDRWAKALTRWRGGEA